jgi:hypothetical protein
MLLFYPQVYFHLNFPFFCSPASVKPLFVYVAHGLPTDYLLSILCLCTYYIYYACSMMALLSYIQLSGPIFAILGYLI